MSASDALLFVGEGKVDAALTAALAGDGVQLRPYAQAKAALAETLKKEPDNADALELKKQLP